MSTAKSNKWRWIEPAWELTKIVGSSVLLGLVAMVLFIGAAEVLIAGYTAQDQVHDLEQRVVALEAAMQKPDANTVQMVHQQPRIAQRP